MDERRKTWVDRQKVLQSALARRGTHQQAVQLFLVQHALVHSAVVSGIEEQTFEDAVWQDLPESAARAVPPGADHSIAWMAWHLARCEDITMNLLVAGSAQVHDDGWLEKMCQPFRDTGNSLDDAANAAFNHTVNIAALRGYRAEVGRRTREIVQALPEGAFSCPVDASRAAQLIPIGAVMEDARYLVTYWANRTIGGLLLMPATRHHMVHWNEAEKVKRKLLRV